jgi:hypothetical protein
MIFKRLGQDYNYPLGTLINKETLENFINKKHTIASISVEEKRFTFKWVFEIMDPETGYNRRA